jgi:hypothetical protein
MASKNEEVETRADDGTVILWWDSGFCTGVPGRMYQRSVYNEIVQYSTRLGKADSTERDTLFLSSREGTILYSATGESATSDIEF